MELDGLIHTAQIENDAEPDRALQQRGLVTLRFTNDLVFDDLEDVLAEIQLVCRQRTGEDPSPRTCRTRKG